MDKETLVLLLLAPLSCCGLFLPPLPLGLLPCQPSLFLVEALQLLLGTLGLLLRPLCLFMQGRTPGGSSIQLRSRIGRKSGSVGIEPLAQGPGRRLSCRRFRPGWLHRCRGRFGCW